MASSKTFKSIREQRSQGLKEAEGLAHSALIRIGDTPDGVHLRDYLLQRIEEICPSNDAAVLIAHNAKREFASELLNELDAKHENDTPTKSKAD